MPDFNQNVTVTKDLPKVGFLSKLSPIAGIAQGGLGLVSQFLQNRWQKKQAERQNQMNMELSKYQYDQQKEMFNFSNQYNSPLAQMQRFKDAGLNPNLIYGQGTAGNAPNVLPQYHAPEVQATIRQPVNPSQVMELGIDQAIRAQQLENVRTQGRILDAEAFRKSQESIWSPGYYRARSKGEQMMADTRTFDLGYKKGILQGDLTEYGTWFRLQQAKLAQYNANIALINANTQLRNKEVGGYMTPLGKSLWNLGTTVAGGAVRAGANMLRVGGRKLASSQTVGRLAGAQGKMPTWTPKKTIYWK